MTTERIQEIADYFYSSDSSEDVPLRLSISVGQYQGFDLDKDDCIDLLTILSKSKNLKDDLSQFLNRYDLD